MRFCIVVAAAILLVDIVDAASLRQRSSNSVTEPATDSARGPASKANFRQRRSKAAEATPNSSSEFPFEYAPMHNASWGQVEAQSQRPKKRTLGRAARVYFLFLAVSKISNWGVWKSFFEVAPPDQYRALIHCKGAACKLFASAHKPLMLVPTVDSSYCGDLVSPMNRLLESALQDDPWSSNPADKFVFVSDSSLPAKPFWHVYNTLTPRAGSDFCVFPSKDWADVPALRSTNGDPHNGSNEVAVKTHQWMVLSRAHTVRAVSLWKEQVMHDMMGLFKMNPVGSLWQDPRNRSFGDDRNFGCLDEYWHMYVLFGPWTIADLKGSSEFHYNDFTGSPLKIKPKAGWQGACDTFALWSDYTTAAVEVPAGGKSSESPWVKLYSSLDPQSVPHTSTTSPSWWDTISIDGIKAIRASDFLFVRKFIEKPTLAYGGDFIAEYSRAVLNA